MRYRASISFEHDTLPVKTHRQEIITQSGGKAASLALRLAREAYPRTTWRSVVIVLEKLGEAS